MKQKIGIKNLKTATTKRGSNYYSFEAWLDGKKYDGKIWDIKESLKTGDIINCEYSEDEYAGKKQIIVDKYKQYQKATKSDIEEIFGITTIDVKSILSDILTTVSNFKNENYSNACKRFIEKYGDSIGSGFGGSSVHHAYEGGLLEHTYNVFKICDFLSSLYKNDIDRELILSAALFHDAGKIIIYDKNGEDIVYNQRGQLEDHLYHSAKIVEEVFGDESDEMIMVRHCVLSHHGNREWGAITEPKTMSAILLHNVDMIDSRYGIVRESVKTDTSDGEFTNKIYSIGCNLYKKMI